jgi:hypothetical protein
MLLPKWDVPLSSLLDKQTGKSTRYGMEEAALSIHSVVFTQTPSFLICQHMTKSGDSKCRNDSSRQAETLIRIGKSLVST